MLTVNAVKKSTGAIISLEDTSAQITIVVPADHELSELTIEGIIVQLISTKYQSKK